jgi:predicted ATPase/DNA-binding SARP family transcriptional activator
MEFRILGTLEVLDGGRAVDVGGPKHRALLAMLLLHANRVVPRDGLIEALWGDRPPSTAPKALQVYVSQLRKALGRERIVTSTTGYEITAEPGELDLERFQTLAADRKLDEALGVWRGAALADFAYDSFAQSEIARLEELRLACLEERIEADLAWGRHAALIGELEALVRVHPLRERLRAQLMLAFYRSGRQAEALEAYQDAYSALTEKLGIEPSKELRELQQSILKQDPGLDAPAAQPKRAPKLPAGVGELPVALTSLLGRSQELAEISALLRGEVRLLTLTGPGGTGKTRLAVEVARELAPEFDEGSRFVELAPLADPDLVVPTVAKALGVRPRGGEPELEALKQALDGTSLVLVLDNYEHLLEAAPVASRLATALPHLTILSTSRAPLRVSGEHVWHVSPLELPATDGERDSEQFGKLAAVALFVERARAAQPTFELGPDNAAAVAEICIRLDGLPLAIELAAARVVVLPPAAMVSRLDRALPVLGEGPRDAPERQQTLERAIAWSYDLLTDPQRKLLRRLSVFAGGWTMEAAETVCDATLDDLAALVEMSLVREAPAGEGQRFTMLRTIREFARDRLIEQGEQVDAERRHAEYFLGLAREANVELFGPDRADWLARLELEHDNLRAALASGLSSEDSELALTLACSLWRFWHTHGHLVEAVRWLTLSLEAAVSPPPGLAANARQLAAQLHLMLGNLVEARALAEQSVEPAREHGDLVLITAALDTLALVHLVEEDLDAAESLLQEVGELTRQTGNRHREATSIMSRGYIALVRQDFERAEMLFRRSRELLSEVGERGDEGLALVNLALATLHDDHRYVETVGVLDDGLAACVEVGSKRGISYCFETLAALAAKRNRSIEAAKLLACAEQLRDEIGLQLEAYEQALHDRTAAFALEALGDEGLAREGKSGRAMTLDEASAYARDICRALVR